MNVVLKILYFFTTQNINIILFLLLLLLLLPLLRLFALFLLLCINVFFYITVGLPIVTFEITGKSNL